LLTCRLRLAGGAGGDGLATASALPATTAISFLAAVASGVLLLLLLLQLEELLLMAALL
jgi:hypothetical protein